VSGVIIDDAVYCAHVAAMMPLWLLFICAAFNHVPECLSFASSKVQLPPPPPSSFVYQLVVVVVVV